MKTYVYVTLPASRWLLCETDGHAIDLKIVIYLWTHSRQTVSLKTRREDKELLY